jgi:hypothetical protein
VDWLQDAQSCSYYRTYVLHGGRVVSVVSFAVDFEIIALLLRSMTVYCPLQLLQLQKVADPTDSACASICAEH